MRSASRISRAASHDKLPARHDPNPRPTPTSLQPWHPATAQPRPTLPCPVPPCTALPCPAVPCAASSARATPCTTLRELEAHRAPALNHFYRQATWSSKLCLCPAQVAGAQLSSSSPADAGHRSRRSRNTPCEFFSPRPSGVGHMSQYNKEFTNAFPVSRVITTLISKSAVLSPLIMDRP